MTCSAAHQMKTTSADVDTGWMTAEQLAINCVMSETFAVCEVL